jgi:hypothetical protein
MTTNTDSTAMASERAILGFLADSQSEVITGGVAIGLLRRRPAAQSTSPEPSTPSPSPFPGGQFPFPTSSFAAIPDVGQLLPSFGSQFLSPLNGITI